MKKNSLVPLYTLLYYVIVVPVPSERSIHSICLAFMSPHVGCICTFVVAGGTGADSKEKKVIQQKLGGFLIYQNKIGI